LIIPHLSVAENLWLFDLNRPWASLRAHCDRNQSSELLTRVGLDGVDLDQPAGNLTPGNRHMLALARAFIVPHKLLILNETTASTNDEHFRILINIVRQRKAAGACVIFVSHKLNEVLEIADRPHASARSSAARDGHARSALRLPDLRRDEVQPDRHR
jgi:ribose transport system ATP-binding protein